MIEITAVIAALTSLLAGGIASNKLTRKLVHHFLGEPEPEPEKTYSERISELTHSLTNASSEVDSVLAELAQVAKDKEASVRSLEQGLTAMGQEEQYLQDRIKALENVPIPAAEHFVRLMETGEKRSAMRDYVLFGVGVVVTTIITIGIQVFSE